jgi:hypothetical protein
MEQRNPNHAVNLSERIRFNAFRRQARRGEYAKYHALVAASLGPISEGEWEDALEDA